MKDKAITKMQAIILIVIIAVAVIAGVYIVMTQFAPKAEVTITVVTMWPGGNSRAGFDAASEAFMEKYPYITVQHSPLPILEFNTIMPTRIRQDPPDVFQWWAGGKTAYLVEENLIMDLSDIEGTLRAEFSEGLYEEWMEYNGNPYCVPIKLNAHGFFYNKEVFAEYGVTVPQTWAELLDVCETIKTESQGEVYPFMVGAMFPWLPDLQFANILGATTGSDLFYALLNSEASWTDAKVVEAFQHYGELVSYMPPYISELGEIECSAELAAGTVAMDLAGQWRAQMCIESGMLDENLGFFKIPTINEEYANTLGMAVDILVASKSTTHPEETKLYLEFMASPEAQRIISSVTMELSPSAKIGGADYNLTSLKQMAAYVPQADNFVTEFGLSVANDELKEDFRNILQEFLVDPAPFDKIENYCARIDDLDWRTD